MRKPATTPKKNASITSCVSYIPRATRAAHARPGPRRMAEGVSTISSQKGPLTCLFMDFAVLSPPVSSVDTSQSLVKKLPLFIVDP